MTIKILLADDHPLTRAGIAEFLRRESSFSLVAEAEDGVKAWDLIQELKPDVALLDIRMPGLDGVSVAQRVKTAGLATATIMLTSYDAQQYVMASLRAGARGFVLKTVSPRELTTAINTVAKGGLYLDPEVASVMGSATSFRNSSPRARGRSCSLRQRGSPARRWPSASSSANAPCRRTWPRSTTSWGPRTRRRRCSWP